MFSKMRQGTWLMSGGVKLYYQNRSLSFRNMATSHTKYSRQEKRLSYYSNLTNHGG